MAAAYLAMIMPLALGLLLGAASLGDKCLAAIGLSLAVLSLIFTGSRGGWISLVVSLAAIFLFGGRRIQWKLLAPMLVLALLTVPFSGAIKERLFGDDMGSAASRVPLNKIAFDVIEDHPLTGVGANNYPLVMRLYAVRGGHLDAFDYSVHNTYLLTWAEIGIGGLIALMWLLMAVIRQGFQCWRYQDPLLGPMALGCAAAVLGLMAHMGVDILLRPGPAADLLWLFAGLVAAFSRISLGGLSLSPHARFSPGRFE
jgi:putative inorganic carbon (HCO3(-)) transporter